MATTALLAAALIGSGIPAAPGAMPAARVDHAGRAARFVGGASATSTVSVRIVRTAARIGHDFGPPAPHMVPRHTFVSAADGRAVPALVYDFE